MDSDGELCRRTGACKDLFKKVSSIPDLDNDWLEDRSADFNWWAYGLSASKTGRSSLDYRVKDRPDVQQVISNLLDSLSHALERCSDIYRDSRPSPGQLDRPSGDADHLETSSEPRSGSVSPWSELSDGDSNPEAPARGASPESPYSEQMFYIQTYVDLLSKISIAIRKSGTKYRYLKADNFLKEHQNENEYQDLRKHLTFVILVSPYEQHLINTLRERVRIKRIPAVIEIIIRSWLTDPARITPLQRRLIESNVVRRNRIFYARRPLKEKEQPHPPQMPRVNIPARVDLEPQIEYDMITPDLGQPETPSVPSREVQSERSPSIITHSVSLTATDIGSELVLPSTARKKGTSAVTKITRAAGGVQIGPKMAAIDGEDFVFDNEEEWRDHTVSTHKDTFSESQLPLLSKISKRRLARQTKCPICRHPPGLARPDEDEHIAEHMHSFALKALPWNFRRDDEESSDSNASLGAVSDLGDVSDIDDLSDTYDNDKPDMTTHDAIEREINRCLKMSSQPSFPERSAHYTTSHPDASFGSLRDLFANFREWTTDNHPDEQNEKFLSSLMRARSFMTQMSSYWVESGPQLTEQFLEIETHVNDEIRVLMQLIRNQANRDEGLKSPTITAFDEKCLADLRVTDPRDDKRYIEDTKGGLFPGSSNWILYHDDFRRWRDDDETRLLWIKGDPGKGKTMLMISIVDEMERYLVRQSPSGSTANSTVLSFFFCQRTSSHSNNATAILRGLIYLLSVNYPSLVSHLRKSYNTASSMPFEGAMAFSSLSKVLQDMLRDESLTRAYVIIDALDECEKNLPQLLKFIVDNSSASSCVKWIVSSRNRPEIEQQLKLDNSGIKLNLELTQNAEQVAHAVNAYIDFKISQVQSLQDDNGKRNQVRDIMRQKASGTFLWVAFVAQELQTANSWDTLQMVEEVPTGLEELYDRMMNQIQQLNRKYPEFCRLVLSTVTLGHSSSVQSVVFSHNSKLLASGSEDGIKIWDAATGALQRILEGHSDRVRSVVFSHNSKLLASGSEDKTIKIWDTATGALQQTLGGHGNSVSSVVFSHNSKLLASGSYDRTIKIWDTATGALQQTLGGHGNSVSSVIFSHNSKLLASGSYDRTIKIWDVATGALQRTLEGHSDWVRSVAFSHDSKLLASGSEDNTIRIWDAATAPFQQTLEGHNFRVLSVVFSHDLKLLASGSEDKTIKIWDAATGALQQTLEGHRNSVLSVVFSNDSKLLASGSNDGIKIWDAVTGALQRILEETKLCLKLRIKTKIKTQKAIITA
ncbi:hypothetical protein DL768_009421 [Monosporascus sp. mg162]|nr:hypothetical protein DL768_009421 [Monosporascus sp. mg162]